MTGKALITGTDARLGRAIALFLAGRGHDVLLHCTNSRESAEHTAEEARALGVQAAVWQADLVDEAALAGLVPQAVAALGGPLNVLINNAQVLDRDTAHSAGGESWNREIGATLRAPFVLTQTFATQAPRPGHDAAGEPMAQASVVNMISQRVLKPTAEFMPRTIARTGLEAFTRTAALALAPAVRVNAIAAGLGLQGTRQPGTTAPEHNADLTDIVATLGYFLDARAVTGQILMVGGGLHPGWQPPDEPWVA